MARSFLLTALLVGLVAIAGCRSGADVRTASEPVAASGRAISVPADEPTIQAAIDHALPGDLVLVSQGVYHEAIDVHTTSVVIRGVDRNGVVLDGGGTLSHGVWLAADGDVVENLTVRNYLDSGVVVSPPAGALPASGIGPSHDTNGATASGTVHGYRVSYVTSYDNDRGGVRVPRATGGLVEHSLASGNGEAGIEIAGCSPCQSVVTSSEASQNSTGLSATNARGNLFVVSSTFRSNRVGLALSTDDDLDFAPQGDTIVAANLVADNDAPLTPETSSGGFGVGIVVSGGKGNLIEHNRVVDHDGVGIALTDARRLGPRDNTVRDNVVTGNGTDLALFLVTVPTSAAKGNCFAANQSTSTTPGGIEDLLVCGGHQELPDSLPPPTFPSPPTGVVPADVGAPGPQASMPNAAIAPAVPASRLLPAIDVTALPVPPDSGA